MASSDAARGSLTARVAALLDAGVSPEDLVDTRRKLGLDAGPEAVVTALARRTTRLPGMGGGPSRRPSGPDCPAGHDRAAGSGGAAAPDGPVGPNGPSGSSAAAARDGAAGSSGAPPDGDRLLVVGEGLPTRLQQAWPQGGPLWLHHRGLGLTEGTHVAVVGTRRATLDGLAIAEHMAHDLARAGIVVVSGMARGIDQAAHRGALQAGGRTVGVLGTGLAVDYPAGSAALRHAVAAQGCLLSEYPPDRGIRYRQQFIARNRILVGLCDAVVVIQAGARSGALNSATWATQFNREVMVVPFSPSDRMAAGSLELLCDGAVPVRGAADVRGYLDHEVPVVGPTEGRSSPQDTSTPAAAPAGIGLAAARMLPLLGSIPATPSALAVAADLTPREVLIGLSELEEAGLVRRTAVGVIKGM